MNKAGIISLIGVLLIAIMSFMSAFIVTERTQAVVQRFGEPIRTIREPGLYFKVPVAEQTIFFDRRILSLDLPPQEINPQDGRKLVVDSFARFRIVDPLKTYQSARTELQAINLLENILDSSVRQILGRTASDNIISGERTALMAEISESTNNQAQALGVEVVDVRLVKVDLPDQNSQAVYDQMRTERQKLAAQLRAEGKEIKLVTTATADRERAEIIANAHRESEIIRGQADGQAVKLFADAFSKDEEFFEFYRSLQAYRTAMNNDDTTLVLSPDSEFFRLFMKGGTDGNKK